MAQNNEIERTFIAAIDNLCTNMNTMEIEG